MLERREETGRTEDILIGLQQKRRETNVEIRRARLSELEKLLPLYEQGRKRMRESGNENQWINGYPQISLIKEDLSKGVCYVACQGELFLAVFTLLEEEEPTYRVIREGCWLNEEPYGTLHRLAAVGQGKGIGRQCIRWCVEKCGNLRVDTHEKNGPMRHILETEGFAQCGRIYVEDGSPRIAYHKVLP